jgi:hypothetical protein
MVFAYTEFPRTNTPAMGEKLKKLRIGKKKHKKTPLINQSKDSIHI